MNGLLVREPEAVNGPLGEMTREIEKRRKEETSKQRTRNKRKLEDEQRGRKAVCFDIRCGNQRNLGVSFALGLRAHLHACHVDGLHEQRSSRM
jgi:hypothetical protein